MAQWELTAQHSMGPLSVLLSTLSVLLPARAYINPQLDLEKLLRVATRRTALAAGKVQRDFAALRMKSMARHLLRPPTAKGRESCLAIKLSINSAARNNGTFIVDAFADAVARYSIDGSTVDGGGLLGDGEPMPQGAIKCRELDQAVRATTMGY